MKDARECMQVRFDKKVAIITGAGSGLGRNYALFLASRGAKVVVNDLGATTNGTGHSEAPAQTVAEEIKARGGQAVPSFHSVAEIEGAERIIDDALTHFGRVDILINNAGVLRDKSLLKMSIQDFEFVVKVHLLGSVYVSRSVLPLMKKNNYGRIVMTTSIAGLFGNFGQTHYSAAKMGIVGFMNSLKLEVEKYHIFVNTVAPLAATRLAEPSGVFSERLKPLLKADLVTPLVAYLCSKNCQSTGNIFSAGGGYYAKVQVVEGPGVRFPTDEDITPERIAQSFDDISNMEGAVPFRSVKDELMVVLRPLMEHAS